MSALVAQLGARRHYAVPRALHSRGLLSRFVTDLCADRPPLSWADALLPRSGRPGAVQRMLGRHVEGVPPGLIRHMPAFALSPGLSRKDGERATEYWARRNAAFGEAVCARGFGDADCVYGFNGAALEIFEKARAEGRRTVLDQTAAPWRYNRELLQAEMAAWPDWEDSTGEQDVSGRLGEREEAEWALADAIVCGSAFAAGAVSDCGGPGERCHVAPYAGHIAPASTPRDDVRTAGPLRVLFVGSLQLRKGVPYLAAAAEALAGPDFEFRAVGKSGLTEAGRARLAAHCDLVGEVPRAGVAAHYDWADVFVLPTLSEGSANVVYEAMAAGLPVVVTPNAGSVVTDGVDGLVIPARDAEALAAALARLAADADLRAALGAAAKKTIAETTLDCYAGRLIAALPESRAISGNSPCER